LERFQPNFGASLTATVIDAVSDKQAGREGQESLNIRLKIAAEHICVEQYGFALV
jgi:hypothetical protein